jgi:hypothetical protein
MCSISEISSRLMNGIADAVTPIRLHRHTIRAPAHFPTLRPKKAGPSALYLCLQHGLAVSDGKSAGGYLMNNIVGKCDGIHKSVRSFGD